MRRAFVTVASAALLGSVSAASAITVPNFSFETPFEDAWGLAPADWTKSGSGGSGLFRPSAYPAAGAGFIAGVLGDQTAYSNGADISQTLSETAEAGSYTLTVAVGDRIDTALPAHRINLRAGGTVIATAFGSGNALSGVEGWSDLSATGSLLFGDAAIGQALTIELVNEGGVQINWDDVRLDFVAAIPVPASALMLVSAFGVAGAVRGRRAVSA